MKCHNKTRSTSLAISSTSGHHWVLVWSAARWIWIVKNIILLFLVKYIFSIDPRCHVIMRFVFLDRLYRCVHGKNGPYWLCPILTSLIYSQQVLLWRGLLGLTFTFLGAGRFQGIWESFPSVSTRDMRPKTATVQLCWVHDIQVPVTFYLLSSS